MEEDVMRYRQAVAGFRDVTGWVRGDTGRCCLRTRPGVGGHRVPECCSQIVDFPGQHELSFTDDEMRLLGARSADFVPAMPGVWWLARSEWPQWRLERSLNDGLLANSLECASHPTRPAVIDRTVVGVVVPDCCNAEGYLDGGPAWRRYLPLRERLMDLWQQAVDLCGVKPYYCTYRVKEGWHVL